MAEGRDLSFCTSESKMLETLLLARSVLQAPQRRVPGRQYQPFHPEVADPRLHRLRVLGRALACFLAGRRD